MTEATAIEDVARAPCAYCGSPVDVMNRRVWRRVIGWERKAFTGTSRRGGSDVALREPRDEYACDACITRLQAGLDTRQEQLL